MKRVTYDLLSSNIFLKMNCHEKEMIWGAFKTQTTLAFL